MDHPYILVHFTIYGPMVFKIRLNFTMKSFASDCINFAVLTTPVSIKKVSITDQTDHFFENTDQIQTTIFQNTDQNSEKS